MTPPTITRKAPLSMLFSRQEYWSGLPCPSPKDLPDPGIEPRSPALQADSLPYFFSLPVYLALSPVPKDCFPLPSPHASRDKDSKGAAGITQEERTLIYAYVHQFPHPQR